MDSPAFEDGHTVLYPEQRLSGLQLREKKPRPPAVARMCCEQLRQGGAGRNGQMPTFAQPAGELVDFGRTSRAAGDQGKACSHTTHNVLVLLLFFVSRLGDESQSCDSRGSESHEILAPLI